MYWNLNKYVVYEGKLYSEYKNKIITYSNKSYYETGPTVRINSRTVNSNTVCKHINEHHPKKVVPFKKVKVVCKGVK